MANNDIKILSKAYYRASVDYKCDWADDIHKISRGRRYVRVVYEAQDGSFQTQRVCLDCWVKA